MNTLTLNPEHFKILQANKEIVDKWIAALRSGNWVQHTGAMTDPNVPNSACCLMVAEAECNNKTVQDFYYTLHDGKSSHSYGLPSTQPNPLYLKIHDTDEYMLLESLKAHSDDGSTSSLNPAQWNDSLELSFEQIATLLETGTVNYK